ncbi:hypothetical protein ABXK61_16240 [Burkholderia sola]|nr:hypothetical protein [Burkholderia sp. AcTa6-5]
MKNIVVVIAVLVVAVVIGTFVYTSLHAVAQAIHTALSIEVTK